MLELGEGNNRSAQTKLVVCCLDIQRGQRCMHSFALPNRDTTPPPCCMMQRLAPRLALLVGAKTQPRSTEVGTTGATTSDFLQVVLHWLLCQEQWVARSPRIASIVLGPSPAIYSLALESHIRNTVSRVCDSALPCHQPQHECFNQRNETVYRTDKESRPTPRQCPPSFTATAPGH
jgi:hypothetical protein